MDILDKLMAHMEVYDRGYRTRCWITTYSINRKGFSYIQINHRHYAIHRLSYEIFKGPILDRVIKHKCKQYDCFNPKHLKAVPKKRKVLVLK